MMDDLDIWFEVMDQIEDEFHEDSLKIREFVKKFYVDGKWVGSKEEVERWMIDNGFGEYYVKKDAC